MAGLGETCTHIAAVLFYIQAVARLQGKETCTQRQCEWIIPSYLKNAEYLPVKSIDFSSATKKKRTLDGTIDAGNEVRTSSSNVCEQPSPSDTDLDTFYNDLSSAGTRPAILSLIPSHSPKRFLSTFPNPLPLLYKSEYMAMEYHELLKTCESVEITVTKEMAVHVKKETRSQSN